LIPFVTLVEDGSETDDQQESDEQDHGIKVSAIGFHIGSSVPAGSEIDDDGYNEQ
jgi:hypothetical protein